MARSCCRRCSRPTWATRARSGRGLRSLVAVADTTHGRDVFGVLRVVLDQRAQSLDVHVERLGVADVVTAPDAIDEYFTGQDPSGVLEQEPQERELLLAQFDLFAVDVAAPRVDVHADRSLLDL